MADAYFSTGQLAALVRRSRETIRRYEALGLIPPGRRDPINGRRYWTAEQAESIRRLLRPITPDAARWGGPGGDDAQHS